MELKYVNLGTLNLFSIAREKKLKKIFWEGFENALWAFSVLQSS